MTSEINSLSQPPLPSIRENPGVGAVNRPQKGQAVAGPQALSGSPVPETPQQVPGNARGEEAEGEKLEGMVSDLNELAQKMRRELQFSVEEDSGQMVVKVIDTETDEIIRQIPAKEVLELRKRLADAAGAIFSGAV
jgi:flagellar protein FlaG